MKLDNLKDLLIFELQDLYDAEKQILKALPKMAEKTTNSQLKKAFESHAKQTETQVERLEKVFEHLDEKPKTHTCEAMKGLIKEGEEVMKKKLDPEVLDAALIAAAQKVEHYEIASYGTVNTFAKQLGLDKVSELLHKTLEEEKSTDEKLTSLAESKINQKAMSNGNS